MKCPVKPGVRGWLLAGAVILAMDILDERTLSESFLEFSRTPVGRIATVVSWSVLTAHLFGVLPSDRDPIVFVFKFAPRRKVMIVGV